MRETIAVMQCARLSNRRRTRIEIKLVPITQHQAEAETKPLWLFSRVDPLVQATAQRLARGDGLGS